MSDDFFTQLYEEVKKLFPNGAVETLVRSSAEGEATPYSAIKLTHKPTGHNIICDAFPTQKENYIYGLIKLRITCDEYPANHRSID